MCGILPFSVRFTPFYLGHHDLDHPRGTPLVLDVHSPGGARPSAYQPPNQRPFPDSTSTNHTQPDEAQAESS